SVPLLSNLVVGKRRLQSKSKMGRSNVSPFPTCFEVDSLFYDLVRLTQFLLFVSRLPYKLAFGVTLEEYEERSDKFNIRGYWEWVNGDVIIYELPSKPHET